MQTQSRIARLRHMHTHLYAKQYLINLEGETNLILYAYLALLFDTLPSFVQRRMYSYYLEIIIQSSSVYQ